MIFIMPKKLLLVDDEEFFLISLKDGLDPLSDIFETDICHSVNEAIKRVVTKNYDLVITDIRMPGKSGIELLIYLRDIQFKGKVMVMSAYDTAEASKQIKSLGAIEVISKPFKLEWFKNMLLERLNDSGEPQAVVFETIDLVTVMQIINLERKNSALQVEIDEKIGMIYFIDGEIVHAEFNGLEGEPAVMKLITEKSGVISVKKITDQINRTVKTPFIHYMINIMKTIDEIRRDQETIETRPTTPPVKPKDSTHNPLANETEDHVNNTTVVQNQTNKKELRVLINEILKTFINIKGYLGAGVFTPQGELIEGSSDISGIHFEQTGSLIHNTLNDSKKMTQEIGFGNLDMMQLYTEMGIVFAICFDDGKIHFHTILVIKTDGNVAMAKLKLNKVIEDLKAVF
jgi:CheY-like chemotaxis protein/predicted regulator of Ras-like GTPase activity (Roadblock/LC7/MglB family)